MQILYNAEELVESYDHVDFKISDEMHHYVFRQTVYEFINKTMEFDMKEFSKALRGDF